MRDTPLGMVEMIRAFGTKGPYGSSLRGLNAVVRINGILFLHGGISPALVIRTIPAACARASAAVVSGNGAIPPSR
jgi:hypothetical protein